MTGFADRFLDLRHRFTLGGTRGAAEGDTDCRLRVSVGADGCQLALSLGSAVSVLEAACSALLLCVVCVA